MKTSISLMAFCLSVFAPLAGAYEYPLQFTPNPGYRGLVVAGYKFSPDGTQVIGDCSYYTVSGNSGSGKGGGGSHGSIKIYSQTCTWDLHGNLLGMVSGAPAVPLPKSINGTQVIFATNANGDSTGIDSALPNKGFVSTPGSHYTWLTPMVNAVLQQYEYTLVATLKSDGDAPLNITEVVPSATLATATLKSTTCIGEIEVGKTCSISVTYDPTKVTSSLGLAFDTFRIDVTSDAGEGHDFVQLITIILASKL
jgi:hypothetical protein